MTVDYNAALRAAREAVWLAVETCIADGHTHMASNCAASALEAYEALARAVGAAEDMQHEGCPSNECAAKREADRLAAPYLEVKA